MKELKELALVLDSNVTLYEELASKTLEEREAIEKCEFPRIAKTTADKENIVFRIKQLEQKRTTLVLKISDLLGEPRDVTLRSIANHPKAVLMRDTLLAHSAKLKEIYINAQELNEFNKRILSNAVRSLRNTILFADSSAKPSLTYGGNRLVEPRAKTGSMLKKAM